MPSGLNKFGLLLCLVVLLISCKAKKELPEGAPAVIKQKELLSLIEQSENDFENLRIKTTGNLEMADQGQNFRAEIRILRDSLIWVELADPVLGLKLARALITPDSVFMINRIDREYLKGDISELQSQFGINYGFYELQDVLTGNIVFEINRDFDLYYIPGYYLLSSVKPELFGQSMPADSVTEYKVQVDPENYKARKQIQYNSASSESYSLSYVAFEKAGQALFPQVIEMEYGTTGEGKLRLVVKRLDQDDPELRYPFNIPSGYAKMR